MSAFGARALKDLAVPAGKRGVGEPSHDALAARAEVLQRPAVARLISLPDDERFALNRIRLVEGRLPDPGRRDEVVALRTFIDAAHVRLGQRLTAVIAGRAFSFTIVGAANIDMPFHAAIRRKISSGSNEPDSGTTLIPMRATCAIM